MTPKETRLVSMHASGPEAGYINLEELAKVASPLFFAEWIIGRCKKKDPHGLSLTERDNEVSPRQVFIEIHDRTSHVYPHIHGSLLHGTATAVLEGLKSCTLVVHEGPSEETNWVQETIELAITIGAPIKHDRIMSIVTALADNPGHPDGSGEGMRKLPHLHHWLRLAACLPEALEYSNSWIKLFADAQFTYVAYEALRRDPELAAYYFPRFVRLSAGDSRKFAIEHVVGLRRQHGPGLRDHFLRFEQELDFTMGCLDRKVDESLRSAGYRPFFESTDTTS